VDRADVTFFAPWIGPLLAPGANASAGGAETQMLMLARGMAERGRRVALVVFPREGLELPPELDGVAVVEVPAPRPRQPAMRALARAWLVVRTVWKLDSPVIVQRIAGPETGLLALIAKAKRSRFVYSSANVVDFDYARLGTGRLKVWLFRLGVRLADAIVVQTPEQVELCRARFGRTPLMIKSAAELAEARSASPDAFLWIGRTDAYKHPEAFVELARALPEARFRMVPMPMGDQGHARVTELEQVAGEVPNLEVLPARPRAELAALIESAVAVVNTSDYEGMPNVFLEGWARGVPALSLTHDPDGVIVREGVGRFASGSPKRLAELAGQLWREREDQAELAARCRDYIAREHSQQAVIDRWLEALAPE
jgi:glycosyltransferase involved in cell wall biosynthesis